MWGNYLFITVDIYSLHWCQSCSGQTGSVQAPSLCISMSSFCGVFSVPGGKFLSSSSNHAACAFIAGAWGAANGKFVWTKEAFIPMSCNPKTKAKKTICQSGPQVKHQKLGGFILTLLFRGSAQSWKESITFMSDWQTPLCIEKNISNDSID